MEEKYTGRLITLAGPSCVGKSPLNKALQKFYPELSKSLQPLILYNSRAPRPGEVEGVDYYFRNTEDVKALSKDERYVVLDVRGDIQALDLEELHGLLKNGDVFFEGNPYVGRALQIHSSMQDIKRLSVFMSPLSREEILYLKTPELKTNLPDLLTDIMRRKLLRRTRRQKTELSQKDLENIERRASSAYKELLDAHFFDFVIPNHDGEDSENWDAFYYPVGDARKSLLAFVGLLQGKTSSYLEKWENHLVR